MIDLEKNKPEAKLQPTAGSKLINLNDFNFNKISFSLFQGEIEIRKEFSKLDTDNSGYITKGKNKKQQQHVFCSKHLAYH